MASNASFNNNSILPIPKNDTDTAAPGNSYPSYSGAIYYYYAEYPFDEHVFYLIEVIVRIALTGTFALLGMVTNVINAVMFYRQGIISDGSTVSLFGLSISEFLNCLSSVTGQCFLIILWFYPDSMFWSWSVRDFYSQIAVRPRTIFTQITCWITAYIAVERFISVVFPFKVKQIITPKRSCFIVASIFLLTTGLYYPQYTRRTLFWEINPWLGDQWKYVQGGAITDEHYDYFLYVHVAALRGLSAVIVLVCNIVIMWKVVISTKFRQTSAGVPGSSSSSKGNSSVENGDPKGDNAPEKAKLNKDNKEQKLVRMMVVICVVFLVCNTPDIVFALYFYAGKPDTHVFIADTAFAFTMFFEITSATVNIFIYYSLSSRYRKELDQTCLCAWRKKKSSSSTSSAAFTSGVSASSTQMTTSLTTKQ